MFINGVKCWHTTKGQRTEGPFLLLFQRKWEIGEPSAGELRALVRRVRLEQFGHFMMGDLKLSLPGEGDPITIGLSGNFGSDDLPLSVPKLHQAATDIPSRLWDMLHPVPEDLTKAFWRSSSDDGTLTATKKRLQTWALKNRSELRKLRVPEAKIGAPT